MRPSSAKRLTLFCSLSVAFYILVLRTTKPNFKRIKSEIVHYAEKYRVIEASWIPLVKPIPNNTAWNKVILFYTPYFRSMPWSQTNKMEMNLKSPAGQPCKVSSCYISYARQDLQRSDAVLFHLPSHLMPWENEMRELFSRKQEGQKWVLFSEENPMDSAEYPMNTLNNMIDITISYHRKSNIKSLYGYYIPNNDSSNAKEVEKLLEKNSFSSGKDRLVLWFASNCVTPRLDIVKAISKYIQVDVYGRCQKYFYNQTGQCGKNSHNCHALAKRYKFYLAIENFQCEDYVTEKYWRNALSRGIVPVVVAGHYNKDLMIPGSYIDILDFPNAGALAEYLHYLDSNDTAYNMYFYWKKNYVAVDQKLPTWICDLCELLHQNHSLPPWNMERFWGVKYNCLADDEYIRTEWLKSKASLVTRLNKGETCWTFVVFNIFYLIWASCVTDC